MTNEFNNTPNKEEMLKIPQDWLKGEAGVNEMKIWLETYFVPENEDKKYLK